MVVVVAPGLLVDEAAVVVAQGGGVVVVVPHVLAAVLEQVGAGVAALTGVDADRGAAGQAVVVEGVGVSGLVFEGPAVEVDRVTGGVGDGRCPKAG